MPGDQAFRNYSTLLRVSKITYILSQVENERTPAGFNQLIQRVYLQKKV